MHVTLRAAAGLPSLRAERVIVAARSALSRASRPSFRVLQYSVQGDHMHLLVEADAASALVRGMQGLAIRVAKAINRALGRRGSVWADRYHGRALRTPREVRNALVYVLHNFRKHLPGARGLDPYSSAAWFSDWTTPLSAGRAMCPVAPPRTWLARVGWMRRGRIRIDEAPRRAP